jgi:uncharacterized protein (TIGR03437 family)
VIACILDAADLQQVTAITPGELLTIFGESLGTEATTPNAGAFPTFLGGVNVEINGMPSPLLYAGSQQVNFQAPFEIAGAAQGEIVFTSTSVNVSGSLTLPIVASDPVAFLDKSSSAANCGVGAIPLAFNADGSRNLCTNPAAAGSLVTMFLDGLGVTAPAQATGAIAAGPGAALNVPVLASNGATAVSVIALSGSISGVWQVQLKMPSGSGGTFLLNLSAGGVAVRDPGLPFWVKAPSN